MKRSAVLSLLFSFLLMLSLPKAQSDEAITIADGCVVSLEYTVKIDDDTVIDSNVGKDPLRYEQGEHRILPALEHALVGLKTGDIREVVLPPAEAYGKIHPEAVTQVAKATVPVNLQSVGMQVTAQTADQQTLVGKITEVGEETVTIDFNHPLAGKTLRFDVRILNVESSDEGNP